MSQKFPDQFEGPSLCNALRPELDVVGTVQNGGLSGDVNPVGAALFTPGAAALYPGGYGTALGQIFRNNFPTYSVGVGS